MSNFPTGYFDKLLVMDFETSGLNFGGIDPSQHDNLNRYFQPVSVGLVVANAQTFEVIEDLYVEIQYDGKAEWNMKAEAVHGLSIEHLSKNGLPVADACAEVASFVYNYWDPNTDVSWDRTVRCAGHNVATFDIWFMRRLFKMAEAEDLMFRTGNRYVDTSSLGYGVFGLYTSDQVFDHVGVPHRKEHNSLDDAYASLAVIRASRK